MSGARTRARSTIWSDAPAQKQAHRLLRLRCCRSAARTTGRFPPLKAIELLVHASVIGSWALAAWLRGALPGVFAVPSGTGDLLTGLFAVPAAIAVATRTPQGRKAAIIWNIFGLADFAVAITLGLITSPGRFQLIVPNVPSIRAGGYLNALRLS